MKANNMTEAWEVAKRIFDQPTELDHDSTERAGYKIYRGQMDSNEYICDLGDRLELNMKEGSINIWVKKERKNPEVIRVNLEEALRDFVQLGLDMGFEDIDIGKRVTQMLQKARKEIRDDILRSRGKALRHWRGKQEESEDRGKRDSTERN